MTALLLKSNQISYETTDVTIDELAIKANLTTDEYIEQAELLDNPTSEWAKILPEPVEVETHLDTTDTEPKEDEPKVAIE